MSSRSRRWPIVISCVLLLLEVVVASASCASAPPAPTSQNANAAPPPAVAMPPTTMDEALAARANAIAALIAESPARPEGLFDDRMGAVYPSKIEPLMKKLRGDLGAVTSVVAGERLKGSGGRFELVFANGARLPMRLFVEEAEAHRVSGLWFDNPIPAPAAAGAATNSTTATASSPAPSMEVVMLERAKRIGDLVCADPKLPPDLFTEEMARVMDQALPMFKSQHAEHGAVVAAKIAESLNQNGARVELTTEKGAVLVMRVYLETGAQHRVAGLWFEGARVEAATLEEVVAKFKTFPGRVSFAACRLDRDGAEPQVVASLEPERALALGSTFKLYVLGTLMDQIRQGKRRWEDVVRLDERWRSLPSGTLQKWPVGSAFTLEALAGAMISVSDNTATDHLLFTLGREKVEAMLAPMGNRSAARNQPFLSTAEMFRLKGFDGGKAGEEFVKKSVAERRRALEKEIPAIDLKKVSWDSPQQVYSLEWFASASDLCRAMQWIKKADGKAARGRELMAINTPGVQEGEFEYAGYKGGSEPGVVNMTWLVKAKDGSWWALSAGWNDDKAVDTSKLLSVASGALRVIARGEAK